jgi:hypothetical protein
MTEGIGLVLIASSGLVTSSFLTAGLPFLLPFDPFLAERKGSLL